MLNEKSPVALYHQVKELLLDKIKSSEWPVNTKIPSERELCELYGVSRITVRQALNDLEKEGYFYRKQGKGTFVTSSKIEQRLANFYSFSEEMRKMGYTPATSILEFKLTDSNENISAQLNINKGDKVYSIKRLRMADNEPFALEVSYIPYDLCPDMKEEEISNQGLYNTMDNKYNLRPDEAEETFEAVLINKKDAEILKTNKSSAALSIERLAYSKGKVVEYCKSVIRGDRFKYKALLK